MPRYGPWHTNTQLYPARGSVLYLGDSEAHGTDMTTAAATDPPANTIGAGHVSPPGVTEVRSEHDTPPFGDPFDTYLFGQAYIAVDMAPAISPTNLAVAYPPEADLTDPATVAEVLTPGWEGFDFESTHGTFASDVDPRIDLFGVFTISGVSPFTFTLWRPDTTIADVDAFHNLVINGLSLDNVDAAIGAATLVSSGNVANGDPVLAPTVWTGSVTYPWTDTVRGTILTLAATVDVRSFTAPPATAKVAIGFAFEGVHGPFYRSCRYRSIFSQAPPLRQFPRDDALGGAPRQGHQSQSIQGSARQGWSGSYR